MDKTRLSMPIVHITCPIRVYIVSTWCLQGVDMVSTWCLHRVYVYSMVSTPGGNLPATHTPGIHELFSCIVLQLSCTVYGCYLHGVYMVSTWCLHCLCACFVDGVPALSASCIGTYVRLLHNCFWLTSFLSVVNVCSPCRLCGTRSLS